MQNTVSLFPGRHKNSKLEEKGKRQETDKEK
jgi:hypothetical protein